MRALFGVGVLGAIACALCCVGVLAPLLVAGLVAAGLGAWAGSLDVVIFGGLIVFAGLASFGWTRMRAGAPGRAAISTREVASTRGGA